MKIAHLADAHLGHRRFPRATAGGQNQREADVAAAWGRAVEAVVQAQPDLIVLPGDMLDRPQPPARPIIDLYQGLARWRQALPQTPIVLAAGNHDTPRTLEPGCILALYRSLGVHVAIDRPQRFTFPGLAVTAMPHHAVASRQAWPEPEPGVTNVLVLHAAVEGMAYAEPGQPTTLAKLAGWDYVALGDYHQVHQVAANAWYSGSLEYASTNPWEELKAGTGKGWLEIELPGPTVTFHPVATRPHLDLEPIEAHELGVEAVNQALHSRLAAAPLEDTVARLVVRNLDRVVAQHLDYEFLRAQRARALALHLDLRKVRAVQTTVVGEKPRDRRPLPEILRDALATRELPPDVDRAALLELGGHYLALTEGGA